MLARQQPLNGQFAFVSEAMASALRPHSVIYSPRKVGPVALTQHEPV